jgi:hypothetical protein
MLNVCNVCGQQFNSLLSYNDLIDKKEYFLCYTCYCNRVQDQKVLPEKVTHSKKDNDYENA